MIESMSASAGKIPLYPPENPAMKCGSINPSTMRRSAWTYSWFMNTTRPSGDFPAGNKVAGSWEEWLTIRYFETMASPTIAASSGQVLDRCEPVPTIMVKFFSGTWDSSSNVQCRRRSVTRGRVISGITTATRSDRTY